MLKYFPLLVLLLCCACEGKTAARKAARGPNFVPDPNHLFFKNMRARHYRAEEITNRATIYRHDGLFKSEAHLRPVLIDNWLQDQAVIRFELSPDYPDWYLVTSKEAKESRRLSLSTPPTNEELLQLATVLQSNDGLSLSFMIDSIMPAFPDEAGRKHAQTVIKDYLTLVGH
ncbi:MAG: hypothetical protein ACI81P_000031 [Neolewinella sp.]|jgi:hypothetical protein